MASDIRREAAPPGAPVLTQALAEITTTNAGGGRHSLVALIDGREYYLRCSPPGCPRHFGERKTTPFRQHKVEIEYDKRTMNDSQRSFSFSPDFIDIYRITDSATNQTFYKR